MMEFFSNPSYLIPPLVVASITSILAILVWRRASKSLSQRLFVGFLVGMALWAVFTFFMRSSPDTTQAVPWEKALIVAAMAAFGLYYHFTIAYTGTRGRRWTVYVVYLLVVVSGTLLFATDLAITGMRIADYGYAPIFTPVGYALFIPIFLFFIGGIYTLFKRRMASTSYEERNRLVYLGLATLIPLIGALLDAFSPLPPAGIWSNLVFSIVCTIIILKYHLLDIRIVVRKGLTYLLTSTAVASIYIGLLTLFNWALDTTDVPVWTHFILVILVASFLRPLWERIQQTVDKWFYRRRYDFLKELERFGREAHDITDIEQLGFLLVRLINRALQTDNAFLLIRAESGAFTTVASVGTNTTLLSLSSGNPVLAWLEQRKELVYQRDLDITPQFQALTSSERKELAKTGAELIVALKNKNSELIGLLILGKKKSGQSYSREDEQLILTVTDRATAELENARLYNRLLRDIQERKRLEAERKEVEKKAQVASRLALVGEMAAGIAHEINNPLTGVIGFAQRLMRHDLPADARRSVELVYEGAQRVASISSRFLSFSRSHSPDWKYVDINAIVDKALVLRHYELQTDNIEVITRLDAHLPSTMADEGQLQQVFLNIIINAETEMKLAHGRGKLTVQSRRKDSLIYLSFEDNGPGIAKEDLGRVFEPFFTTREAGQGTGLGLSLSRRMIAQHGGRIYAISHPGKGATFVIELPIMEKQEKRESVNPIVEPQARNKGRILVVDDEPSVLEFLAQVLGDEGHKVDTASNGTTALEKISAEEYDLVLLDVRLPQIGDIEVYYSIERMSRRLARKVVLITADINGADTQSFLKRTGAKHLAKPFDTNAVNRVVHSILQQP